MVSHTRRGTVLLALAMVAPWSYGLEDEGFPHIPCLIQRTAGGCRDAKASLFSHCVWCKSKTLPDQCVTPDLAEKMPRMVFKCDGDDDDDKNDHVGDSSGEDIRSVDEEIGWGIEEQPEATTTTFEAWRDMYGVSYESEDAQAAGESAYESSLREIAQHDSALGGGGGAGPTRGPRYTLGLNRFSDMTWDDFQATRLGFGGPLVMSQNCSATHHSQDSHYRALGLSTGRSPPRRRDWRELGAVSVVKNQDHCGSCWTFSTTGSLESHHYLRTGEMVLLSEQQLLDCAGNYDNHGCSGGLPSHAFEYIASAGGLDTEAAYPYLAEESGSCSFAQRGVGADVMRAVNITFQDEAELLEAVGNTGPVSVAFQVAPDFKAYAGGVYDNPSCSTLPEEVNHAVLCVGYDTTEDGVDYWIIKNSWGSDWGIDGYFHMVRGKNMCGVADCASFPLVP